MLNGDLVHGFALIIGVALVIWFAMRRGRASTDGVAAARDGSSSNLTVTSERRPMPVPPPTLTEYAHFKGNYRIEPFHTKEYLYTLAEFKEILKRYSCSSDNGTGLWANAVGHWVDNSTGEPVKMDPDRIRAGEQPEDFFTHIEYLPK